MKEKLSKFIHVLKKDGIFKTIHKTYKYCMANYINKINIIRRIQFKIHKKEIANQINEILSKSKYERILVWRGSFGWNVPLYQRPQHIARALSDMNCLILYEVTRMTDKTKFIDKFKNNLYLVNYEVKEFENILFEKLKKINKTKYLQLYSTCWDVSDITLNKYVSNGFKLLYEYIDDLNPLLAGTKELPTNVKNIHEYVCNNIDNSLVVTSADKLYKDIVAKRKNDKNVILSTNGVEYKHFANIKEIGKLKKECQEIVDSKRPIIGYYGALASWFDYELIENLANKRPDIDIVLFGIKYDNSFDESNIEKVKNIHYLGKVNYFDLPQYANIFDVCIIPFLINEITEATNPIKVFEYMALGKPIVTTAMDECKKYKSVFIANNEDEFIELIDKSLKLNKKNNKGYFDILKKEALENTWESKASEIAKLLKETENKKIRFVNNKPDFLYILNINF